MEIQEEKKSKFDLTLQTLMKVSEWVNDAADYRVQCYSNGRNVEALNNWFHKLDPIYIELSSKLSEDEEEQISKLFKHIPSMDIRSLVLRRVNKNGSVVNAIDRKRFDELFMRIRALDKKIRYYLDKKNMRIASADDGGWGLRA